MENEYQSFDRALLSADNTSSVAVLPQYQYFPRNFSFLYFRLSCLMGYLTGCLAEYLWKKYGDSLKLWFFDKTTSAFTTVRLMASPYYTSYVAPCFALTGTGKGLYIHKATLHYRNRDKYQPTLRRTLEPHCVKDLLSNTLTPESFKAYITNLSSTTDFSNLKVKAMVIEYSFGPQHFFHVVPCDEEGNWFGAKSFLPEGPQTLNEDYAITKPTSSSDSLCIALRTYLEAAPVPSRVLFYLKDHPEVFQAPDFMSEKERENVWSRFFDQKEEIILEDDLGDLIRIGMFE